MGIGSSNTTKREMKTFNSEREKFKTKKELLLWFSTGKCDAIMLTNIKTMEEAWYPMINGCRFCEVEKVDKFDSYEDAYVEAVKIKKQFAIQAITEKN